MEATLAALQTNKCHACSDLGAAGIGAAVCESARYGGFGALTDLAKVPIKVDCITPEEILICETQGRYVVQVGENDVDEILSIARREGARAEVIGEITDDDRQIFRYAGETIATIFNQPSEEILEELKGGG